MTDRNKYDIMACILSHVYTPRLYTHIMMDCDINSKQASLYIRLLLQSGMIHKFEAEHKRSRYISTGKGQRYLVLYKQVCEIFGGT